MNKSEFIAAMEQNLLRLPKADRDDILNDFEIHFVNGVAEGRTEEEISAELGDPAELAAVYLDNLPEGSKGAAYVPPASGDGASAQQGAQGQPYQQGQPVYPQGWVPVQPKKTSAGGIAATVLLSVFIALPILGTLASIFFGMFGAAIGCFFGSIGVFIAGVTTIGFGALSAFGLIILSLALLALAVLLVALIVLGVKGVIRLVMWYIEFCKNMIGGNI